MELVATTTRTFSGFSCAGAAMQSEDSNRKRGDIIKDAKRVFLMSAPTTRLSVDLRVHSPQLAGSINGL